MPPIETPDAGDSAQALLQLRLLGVPELTWAGEPLQIPRRQPRAILYRLAVQMEPIPRDHFCLLLWSDLPDSEARRHLSNQLYNLRRALPDRELIQTSSGQLGLDRQRIWSDVEAFKRLAPSSGKKELQRAARLYRGPFLDGFSLAEDGEFSRWMDERRRVLQQKFLDTLSSLMAKYAVQGDYDASIACARRYLEIDDLAEEVHRRLIDLYAAQGNRSAALRQYEQCAAVLERELGVDPLPETHEVYLAVLQDRTVRAEPSHVPPTFTTLPSLEASLVGRDKAIARLKAAFSEARAGSGSALLVSGEAGVGKSRLLQEFVTENVAGGTVLAGNGYEAQGEVAYLPLVEALRPLLPTIDWDDLGADSLHLAQLLRLLPELSGFVPGLSELSPAEQEQEESPLFGALAHLLLCLARRRPPLVLCLDDLHWADETTRSWLGYLGPRLREAPLLLLGGYRSEEAEAVKPLRASLTRVNVLHEVKLQGLTEQDVRHLVARLSGQPAGHERFCRRMQTLTGGNPFFLLETLRALFDVGLLQSNASGWRGDLDRLTASFDDLPWPDSVTDAVRRRVSRLRPATAQVLQASAVLGQRFQLDLLQATSGRSEHEVLNALDELVARQLVTIGQQWYQFRHDLIQAIIAEDLSYGRRRLLHRRAGKALEEREPENAAALARHFGEAGETEKAISYSLRAGDQARKVYAYQEAVGFYRRALALQKESGDLQAAARTLMRLGLSYQIAYDYRRAHEAYAESHTLQQKALASPPEYLPPAPHPLRFIVAYGKSALDPGSPEAGPFFIKKLFSGLLRSGEGWTVRPEVARAWEISDDGRRYVFHLRHDVFWTDGEPVTAHDFAFAWKRVLHRQRGDYFPRLLYAIKGAQDFHRGQTTDPDSVAVRAADTFRLKVELEEPAGYFLNLVTTPIFYPVPRHIVKRHGKAWAEPSHLVSNGPFRLDDWIPGERMTLVRNPHYFGGFPGNLAQVEITLREAWSPVDELAAYRADQVDILLLQPETYHARHQYPEEYRQAESPTTYFLGFGSMQIPFADRRVRRVLSLAIDREDLARQTTPGYFAPATGGFVPAGVPGHSPGIGLPFDPERARMLLGEAGHPGGKGFPRVDLLTPRAHLKQAKVLQGLWERHLGIKVNLDVREWGDFFRQQGQAALYLVGWGAYFYSDPDYFLRVGVHTVAEWWQHPGYEGLIQEAMRIRDQAERVRLYRQADRILIDEAPILPLLYRVDNYLVKPWVKTPLPVYLPHAAWTDVTLEPH